MEDSGVTIMEGILAGGISLTESTIFGTELSMAKIIKMMGSATLLRLLRLQNSLLL
jgi:hypothetical protein